MAMQIGLPPHPRRDRDETRDARGLGAAHHAVELVLEVRKIEMAVAVDQLRHGQEGMLE